VPRFPRPSGPKHFFTWVSFHSAWFLKNLLGYVSLSFTAPTCREESFHSALRTQPSMCLVSLGLLDLDPNNFLHGFTFPQPGFSKTCCGTFPSASRHLHVQKSRFTVPRFPWPSGPKSFLTRVYFPSAWFLKNLLGTFPSASCHQHVESSHSALRT